jgi:hypothetical protein
VLAPLASRRHARSDALETTALPGGRGSRLHPSTPRIARDVVDERGLRSSPDINMLDPSAGGDSPACSTRCELSVGLGENVEVPIMSASGESAVSLVLSHVETSKRARGTGDPANFEALRVYLADDV